MMNRIIVGLGVGLLFGLTQSTDAQQQKKALDINACMSWKRVDIFDRKVGYVSRCFNGI